jgi:hypothetical protein
MAPILNATGSVAAGAAGAGETGDAAVDINQNRLARMTAH